MNRRYLFPEPLLQSPGYVAAMARSGMSVPTFAYGLNNPLRYIDSTGLFVTATFDRATGLLVVTDMDTGRSATMTGKSGIPNTSSMAANGPIPLGKWWIYDHPDEDFFRLDADDGGPPDDVHGPSGRKYFRLHKRGSGRTTGCIGATERSTADGDWERVRDLIKQTSTATNFEANPDYSWPFLTRYGELHVIDTSTWTWSGP